jgi:trans-2,3-dihydro-3-hydroxyanthranilate isomerase
MSMTGGDAAREWRMVAFPVAPDAPSGGNPAGVVFDPVERSPEEMVATSVRLNPVSETAFVWPPEDGPFRLRYFAPGGEVPLCGHATAAAYGALALADRLGPLPARVGSVAPGGSVSGRVEREGEREGEGEGTGEGGHLLVWLDMPVARRVDGDVDVQAVAEALALPHEVLASRPAAAIEDVGIRVALLPVANLEALDSMHPDFGRLREIGRAQDITVFYPFVLDPDGWRVRARGFAPAVDIDEDPATGTAAAALGAFLARENLVPHDVEVRIRQGEAMGRASEIRLRVRSDAQGPRSVQVGGWVRGEPVPGR